MMEATIPKLDSQNKLLNDVLLLIDLKIRNIENETSRAIHTSHSDYLRENIRFTDRYRSNHHQDSNRPKEDLLRVVEECSKARKRLTSIKALLAEFNVMNAIELLSNDRFMLCPENMIQIRMTTNHTL